MTEVWKEIHGYEGLYDVSTKGRIKRLEGQVPRKCGGLHKVKERILSTSSKNMGYPVVNLYKDGKKKQYKVHRIVAENLIPNPLNKPIVNHIDNDKTNNNVTNLEWATISENTKHSVNLLRKENEMSSYPNLVGNIDITNQTELWKDILGFEGLYLVSTHGRIKNVKTGRILKDNTKVNGFRKVKLMKNNKSSHYYVHRLVAEAFINNEHNKQIVQHRDGNLDNNTIGNLLWITYSENYDLNFSISDNRENNVFNIECLNNLEIWKDIEEFGDYYQISNIGRVRSKDRIIVDSWGRKRKYVSRILKLRLKNGYFYASLSKENYSKDIAVHRLVALAFIPNPDVRNFVNHINSNRADNRVENLEWATPKENMIHMSIMNRGYVRSVQQYDLTGVLIGEYPSVKKACKENKLDYRSLLEALSKNNSHCGGYQWKYTDDDKVIIEYEPANNQKVNQYELSGEFIQSFLTIDAAVKYLRDNGCLAANGGNISRACKRFIGYAYNFQWRYVNDNKPVNAIKPFIRRIVQLTIDGEYINQFESIRAAEIANNIKVNFSNIGKCCKGKLKTANGYKWMYEDEYTK